MTEKNKKRATYSKEFKVQAVAKCREIGINRTNRELGVSRATLRSWVSKSQHPPRDSNKPSYEDLERENQKLKCKIGYINEINKILKKALRSSQARKWDICVDSSYPGAHKRHTHRVLMHTLQCESEWIL